MTTASGPMPRRKRVGVLVMFVVVVAASPARSQVRIVKEDPVKAEFREFFEQVSAAYNAGDLDKFAAFFDDRCIVTWQNAEVKVGSKQVKDYLKETTQGRFRFFDRSHIDLLADGFSVETHGKQIAVAHGHSLDHYELAEGAKYDQWTTWTATVIQHDGRWKIASLHLSANMFDNPVVAMVYQRTAWWTGGIVGVVAVLVGVSAGWLLGRWRSGTPTSAG